MGELEEKISAILNSKEGMEQIMSVAKAMTGEASPLGETGVQDRAEETQSGGKASDGLAGLAGLGSLGSLGGLGDLSGLGGLGGLDPKMMSMLLRIMNELNSKDDDKTAILGAIKPYLREERRDKVDRAVKMAKLAKVAKATLTGFNSPS